MFQNKQKILITGGAGFIGFHLSQRLLDRGDHVCVIDIVNDYYDVNLKQDRLKLLEGQANFIFIKADIADRKTMFDIFTGEQFDVVVKLATQADIRYSLINLRDSQSRQGKIVGYEKQFLVLLPFLMIYSSEFL